MFANLISTVNQKNVSLKVQTVAAFLSVIAAVVFPQFFHLLGAISGLGTSLGEIFLPMHLPIIFIGLLAGPYAGAISGILSPLVSAALTGMPTQSMLPFIMIELYSYGLVAGLIRNIKLPSLTKILIVQISGRLTRAVAILLAVNVLSISKISTSIIWTSISKGVFGIVLQLALIPLALFYIENLSKND